MSQEQTIIARIGQLIGDADALADDAFYDPQTRQIYTADLLVENRHFRLDYFMPEDLGWKAAAVNISDIAAMGGAPKYLLVSIGLPETLDLAWVERLYEGMLSLCRSHGVAIVGGDTVGSDRVVINVTAIGELPAGHELGRRNQALPGDLIVATGYHGLSRVGLAVLQNGTAGFPAARRAHLRPEPRVEEGLFLSAHYTRYALMDSSDGLADALLKMADASRVRLIADAAKIPVHPEVEGFARQQGASPLDTVLYGGEDFQLVACLPPGALTGFSGGAAGSGESTNGSAKCSSLPAEVLARFHIIGRVEALEADEAIQNQSETAEYSGKPAAWLTFPDGKMQTLSMDKTYRHFGGAHG